MHEVTEFYDQTNARVIGWQAATKRACDRQPTSRPDRLTADTICQLTGLMPLFPFETPEGMVAVGDMSVEVVDGAAYKRYDTITIEEHEDANAQREQTRILGLVQNYGADVAIMGRLLAMFTDPATGEPFRFPCVATDVMTYIKGGLATGQIALDMAPFARTLEERYERVKQGATDAEIASVAAILEAQA